MTENNFIDSIIKSIGGVTRGSWIFGSPKGDYTIVKRAKKYKIYATKTIVKKIKKAEFTDIAELKSFLEEA